MPRNSLQIDCGLLNRQKYIKIAGGAEYDDDGLRISVSLGGFSRFLYLLYF